MTSALKKIYLTTCIATALMFINISSADVIILKKDKRKVEGDIVAVTPTEIRINVKISETISDQKIIPRSEVLEYREETKEEKLFKDLSEKWPTKENLSPPHKYNKLVAEFTEFINIYPLSEKKAEAEKIIEEIKQEKDKVSAGFHKIADVWYSPSDYKMKANELEAGIKLDKLKNFVKERQYLKALNAFEQIEKQHPYTKAHAASIKEVLGFLDTYTKRLKYMSSNREADLKKLEESYKILPPNERELAKTRFENDLARFKKKRLDLKEQGTKWLPYNRFDDESLKESLSLAETEKTRLEETDTNLIMSISKLISEAKNHAEQENLEASEKILADIESKIEKADITMADIPEVATIKKKNEETRIKIEKSKEDAGENEILTTQTLQGGKKPEEDENQIKTVDFLKEQAKAKKQESAQQNNAQVEKTNNVKRQTPKKNAPRRSPPPKRSSFSFKTIFYIMLGVMVIVVGFLYYREKKQKDG